jgi:hypothetical protein
MSPCALQAESDAAPLQLVVQVYEVCSSTILVANISNAEFESTGDARDKLLGTAALQLEQVLQAAQSGTEVSCQLQLQQKQSGVTVKRVTLKVVTSAGPPLQRLRALWEDMKVTLLHINCCFYSTSVYFFVVPPEVLRLVCCYQVDVQSNLFNAANWTYIMCVARHLGLMLNTFVPDISSLYRASLAFVQVSFEVLVVECIGITVAAQQHAAAQVALLLGNDVIACTELATVIDSCSSTASAPAALWMQPLRVQVDRLQLVRYSKCHIYIESSSPTCVNTAALMNLNVHCTCQWYVMCIKDMSLCIIPLLLHNDTGLCYYYILTVLNIDCCLILDNVSHTTVLVLPSSCG